MPIKVSVITVCYNSERTLEQTLKSVIRQDYPNMEYIVIDGGSTDSIRQILQRYQNQIDLVISEPDRGIYDAMNKGIQFATGDLIGFLNSDDLYAHPQILSRVVKTFENQPIDACYGDLIYFSEN